MPQIVLPRIIERIDRRKRELGFVSDMSVCRVAGLDPDYLRATIRRRKEPGVIKLMKLANALQCSLNYLIYGDESDTDLPLDQVRMIRVLTALAGYAFAHPGILKPGEFAKAAMRLYDLGIQHDETEQSIERVITQLRNKTSE